MPKKLHVLIISYLSWRDDNNSGNTFSNLFGGLENQVEFAHIYCRDSQPMNSICHQYFHIPEREIFPGRSKSQKGIGQAFYLAEPWHSEAESFTQTYDKMRTLRWNIFYFGRDILWDFANWKTDRLDAFVEDFKPDIVFGSLTPTPIINKIMAYICSKYQLPLAVYAGDDYYQLRKKSLSPLYWIMRSVQRKWIRETVSRASCLYAITQEMSDEYRTTFGRHFSVLTKGHDFKKCPSYNGPSGVIKCVYAGNIGAGRWKVLATFVSEIANVAKGAMTLDIYTLTPVDQAMRRALSVEGVSRLMGAANPRDLPDIHKGADVLVHVEPVGENERRQCRLSFSTKIVDYFEAGRCLLAIGGPTASTDYLKREDAALVVQSQHDLRSTIEMIVSDTDVLKIYAKKAWDCGAKNHKQCDIQGMLMDDFRRASGC